MAAKAHSKLWTRVRRLFAADEQALPASPRPAQTQPAATPIPQPPPQGQILNHADQARIEELLAQRPAGSSVVSGRIDLLNIDLIRQRLGSKWPRYEEQVHHLVAETLKRRLSEKDFFTRAADDTYMILFHDSSEAEAKLKCALLGQEISRKFFGEIESQRDCALTVETLVATVDGDVAREGIRLSDALSQALTLLSQSPESQARRRQEGMTQEEIQELLGVAEERFVEIEEDSKAAGEISLVRDHMRELIRQLKNIEGILASADQQWISMAPVDGQEPEGAFLWRGERVNPTDVVRDFITRADRTIESTGKPVVWIYDDEETQGLAANVRTQYFPLWSVAKQSVGLYLCQSFMTLPGSDGSEQGPVAAEAELNLIAILDRITLRRAKAQLEEMAEMGISCLLVIPVHFSTLNRPGAAESYLPICHGISSHLRRMIVWEVRRVPLDGWSTHSQRIVAGLQSVGRAVFILAHITNCSGPELHRLFARLAAIKVQGVGFDAENCEGTPDDVIVMLERFAVAATKHAMTSYVYGLHSLSMSTAAIRSGFDHIAGAVIGEPLESPKSLREVPLLSLYSHRTERAAGSND